MKFFVRVFVVSVASGFSLLFLGSSFAQTIKLNGNLQVSGDIFGARISPNGMYMVYLADQNTDGVTNYIVCR